LFAPLFQPSHLEAFQTAQTPEVTLPLKADSVRFIAIGDMGTGERPQYELAERMEEFRKKTDFKFAIMLGDNIYGGKSPGDLARKFEAPYKTLLDAGVQFFAALGNHDDISERFYKYFNMNGKQYFTFKKNNVRFYSLDSVYMDRTQLAWLENELANAGNDWKICYFHHPLYSSGGFHGSSTELRQVLEPVLVKYGVQVVFAGHEHLYERVKPQKGIYYFTEGASGELRAGDLKKTNMTEVGYDRDRSFLAVEISGDELYFQTVTRTGKTVDSGVIRKPEQAKAGATK